MESGPDMTKASVAELLTGYANTLAELRRRGVLRTNNPPAGDYAEWLIRKALGGALAPNSEKSHDVTLDDGQPVQVKARVVSTPRGPVRRRHHPSAPGCSTSEHSCCSMPSTITRCSACSCPLMLSASTRSPVRT